jgi:hypothetical protein
LPDHQVNRGRGMRKVLIITYYWPPSGGAGVQRWLKFSKYFREFGWEPIIYTPLNPEAPALDESLIKDVPADLRILKTPIWEPYSIYKKFARRGKPGKINAGFLSEEKPAGLAERISVWIRGNFFIPDARCFWISPSVKFLEKFVASEPVDLIISTGPPHSMHMIALGIKNKFNIPWIADFRDPWTHIDFYDKLNLMLWADRKHKQQEHEVIKNCDKLVTVSSNWAEDFKKLGVETPVVITNGYDPDDFSEIQIKNPKFELCHVGSVNADRNPVFLWKVIEEICIENETFRKDVVIKFVGNIDYSVKNAFEKCGLTEMLINTGYVNHDEAIAHSSRASVLLLLLNNTPNVKGIIPGKLFEYLGAKRPIICIGDPSGDSASILDETMAGITAGFTDKNQMRKVILNYYQKFQSGTLHVDSKQTGQFSRKSLAEKYCGLMNEMVKS